MRCPPPELDWGVTAIIALVLGGALFIAGTLWGQKTGPPKNWSERVEPPDPKPLDPE